MFNATVLLSIVDVVPHPFRASYSRLDRRIVHPAIHLHYIPHPDKGGNGTMKIGLTATQPRLRDQEDLEALPPQCSLFFTIL